MVLHFLDSNQRGNNQRNNMATENTLKIRNIGRTTQTVWVKHPWSVKVINVTRALLSFEKGKVIHSGGQRIGKFK